MSFFLKTFFFISTFLLYQKVSFSAIKTSSNLIDLIKNDINHSTIEAFIDINKKTYNFNETDKFGNTPLMLAAERDDDQTVQLLIDVGANVNAKNDAGSTALHIAFMKKSQKCIDLLQKTEGVDIHQKDNDAKDPFYYSTQE